jgi:ubiquinone/menaquinone biosynthesis C-methylase UbiE
MRVTYYFCNPFGNFVFSIAKTTVLRMLESGLKGHPIIVEIGCGTGTVTRCLPSNAQVVGLEIDKWAIRRAKKFVNAEFIQADAHHLPFRKNSIDIILCVSVLEHVRELKKVTTQITNSLKENGRCFVGYPIQTVWLKAIIELMNRPSIRVWDPLRVMTYQEYLDNPGTHKQEYRSLRRELFSHMSPLKKIKVPSKYMPDFLSVYECLELKNKPSPKD